jgi:hypothetical protein
MSHCRQDRAKASLQLVQHEREENPMSILRVTAVAAVAAAATVAAGSPALAKDGDVRARGVCSGTSTSKLKLSDEDGRIEVEFEVDQNRNGVPWRVSLRRNGALVAATSARTRAPSGSFSMRRVISNAAGADRVVATATRASGERCTAKATF